MYRTMLAACIGLATCVGTMANAAEPAATTAPPRLACAAHAELVTALSERYDEERVSIGLQNNGQLLEIYASKRTGSWTALSTRTDGTACILAVGRHYEQQHPAPDANDMAS